MCFSDVMVQAEFCFAPVSDSVPEHLQCHLPQRFLDSAVVDSFATEARLKHLHPDQFPVIYMSSNRPFSYHTTSSLTKQLMEELPSPIFLALLDWGLIDMMEGKRPVDSFQEKYLEEHEEHDIC